MNLSYFIEHDERNIFFGVLDIGNYFESVMLCHFLDNGEIVLFAATDPEVFVLEEVDVDVVVGEVDYLIHFALEVMAHLVLAVVPGRHIVELFKVKVSPQIFI